MPDRSRHVSASRVIGFVYFSPPEFTAADAVDRLLIRAHDDGVITQWNNSRGGQSFWWNGPPSKAHRTLRARIVSLLGGPGRARTWEQLPACKHSDCWQDCGRLRFIHEEARLLIQRSRSREPKQEMVRLRQPQHRRTEEAQALEAVTSPERAVPPERLRSA